MPTPRGGGRGGRGGEGRGGGGRAGGRGRPRSSSHSSLDGSHLLNFRPPPPPPGAVSSSSSGRPRSGSHPGGSSGGGSRGGTKRRETHAQRQRRERSEYEERRARRELSGAFFLHASSAHAFALTRKVEASEGGTIGSSSSSSKGAKSQQQQHQLGGYNYSGPDVPVRWSSVRLVRCLVEVDDETSAANRTHDELRSGMAICPICLDAHVAPRITKCGHAFCLPCVMRHLYGGSGGGIGSGGGSGSGSATAAAAAAAAATREAKCPCCSDATCLDDLRPVRFVTVRPPSSYLRAAAAASASATATAANAAGGTANRSTSPTYNAGTMSFTKLHRHRSCPSPYLPQPGAVRRRGPHAAPDMSDMDGPYCRFNYVDPDAYVSHLENDLAGLERHLQELMVGWPGGPGPGPGPGANLDVAYCQMAMQCVRQAISLAGTVDRAEEEELRRQYGEAETTIPAEEAVSFMLEEESRESEEPVVETPPSPSKGPTVLGPSPSSDGIPNEQGLPLRGSESHEESKAAEGQEGASMSMLGKGGCGIAPTVGGASPIEEEAYERDAPGQQQQQQQQSEDGGPSDRDTNKSEDQARQQQKQQSKRGRIKKKSRGHQHQKRRQLVDLPASMYLEDEYTAHFYQASDGQLCFLSGFNMNNLLEEFSAFDPATEAARQKRQNVNEEGEAATIDDSGGMASESAAAAAGDKSTRNPKQKRHLARHLRPLPDTISGPVVHTEAIHLTPPVRKRFPFLSHLPHYTTVTFVELDLDHVLSPRTKAKFKAEFDKRRKKRRDLAKAEKRADRMANKQEAMRIEEVKAMVQQMRVDPNDDFFHHGSPVGSFEDVPPDVHAEGFGPDLAPPAARSRPTGATMTRPESVFSFRTVAAAGGVWPGLGEVGTSGVGGGCSSVAPSSGVASAVDTTTAWGRPSGDPAAAGAGVGAGAAADVVKGGGRRRTKGSKGKKVVLFSTGGQRGAHGY